MTSISMSTTVAAGMQSRPAGPPPPQRAAMDAAARLIGLEPSEMRQQLEGGASLADLATNAGVSTDDLKSVMTEAIASSAPAGAVERMTADLDSVIAGDRRPPPPRSGGPGRSGGGEQSASDALTALATSLDLDLDSLMSSIKAGSFADLLNSSGIQTNLGMIVNQSL